MCSGAGVGCAPSLSQIAVVMDGPDLLPPYLVPGRNRVQRAQKGCGRRVEEKERSKAARRLEPFQHRGELRADRCSFLSPLTVTEALGPLCRLSGATDRLFP